MLERGLSIDQSPEAKKQADQTVSSTEFPGAKDMRGLPWCSIDNGKGEEVTSKDLDQITLAEAMPDGSVKVLVAIADVDALVPKGSPLDLQAAKNTTTVYTAFKIYPMIDPRLSEDKTSLNQGEDRVAVVTEMLFKGDGEVHHFEIYRAIVQNKVKLNYDSVGAWFAGKGAVPAALANHPDIQESLLLQDKVAQDVKALRRRNGSLELESQEAKATLLGNRVTGLEASHADRATELIENLMVSCNGCASRYLRSKNFPTFQRIVRKPKYWESIVELASDYGWNLPKAPKSKALEAFLEHQRAEDPVRFPDLSLSVLKLLGRGEYVVEMPDEPPIGHFGLAVREYSHSTAPNRRYPDIITQRLLKAALEDKPCPYDKKQLTSLASHCSKQEGLAQKVERQTQKSAAASLLSERIGEVFPAVVSGVNKHGTWARLLELPIEGKLNREVKLGTKLQVRLSQVNIERGFIDFQVAH